MVHVRELYLGIWEFLYLLPEMLRAFLLLLIFSLITIAIINKLFPQIIKGFSSIIYYLVRLIVEYVLMALLGLLIRFIRHFTENTPFIIRLIDKTLELILKKTSSFYNYMKSFPNHVLKYKHITVKVVFSIYILFVMIYITSTIKPIEESRIGKHSKSVTFLWNDFEHFATLGVDIKPAVVKNDNPPLEKTTEATTKYFTLNASGKNGARINIQPIIDDSKPVTIVTGKVSLLYLNESSRDKDGRVWYKVKAPNEKIGWISGRLVE